MRKTKFHLFTRHDQKKIEDKLKSLWWFRAYHIMIWFFFLLLVVLFNLTVKSTVYFQAFDSNWLNNKQNFDSREEKKHVAKHHRNSKLRDNETDNFRHVRHVYFSSKTRLNFSIRIYSNWIISSIIWFERNDKTYNNDSFF